MQEEFSKNEQERLARLSASRIRKFKKIVLWLIVIGAIVGAGFWFVDYSKKRDVQKPGEAIADLGRNHILVGSEHEPYNSNPPTSGSHYEEWAKWGVFEEKLLDEQLIHNLEHGGIWISYQNKDDKALFEQLKDIADDYTVKVILTYRPENDAPIALAAWARLLKLQSFDEKQIKGFIRAYINRGPEQVPF